MIETVATRVVTKYLKKGNMARCLRDILPSAGLSKKQREDIAEIVHDVVRWKKLYEYIIDNQGLKKDPKIYVKLAMSGAHADAHSYPFEYRYSCSSYVAAILKEYSDWAEFLNERPPTALCVNLNTTTVSDVMNILHEEQIPSERSIIETAILTTSVSKYSQVIQQRLAHVQDEGSQLISSLTVSLGDTIFDFCAGNGGKSLAIASLSKNTKNLSAYELNATKRATLRQRCLEYKTDITIEDHPPKKEFDVVLVDAPCTGIGAARRNPEAKYVEEPGDLPQTQLSILKEAATYVKTNGILFYAVCTITPEETTQVIQQFTEKNKFTTDPLNDIPYTEYLQKTKNGAFTKLPRADLFFISLLHKKE